jgi:hypothetical protein
VSITCLKCGWRNENGTEFCVNDGAYLKFDGQQDDDEVDTPAPIFEQATQRPGIIERVKTVLTGDAGEAEPPQNADLATAETAETASPPPQRSSPSAPAARPDADDEARAIFRPASEEPSTKQPGPTLPQEERARPVKKPPTVTREKFRPDDDVICTECGWGNRSTQNFCRACGQNLAEATPVHVPWWRRLFRRKRNPVAAGTRRRVAPRRKGRLGTMIRNLVLLGLVVLVVLVAGPWREDLRKRFLPRYTEVNPTGVTLNDAPAPQLIDHASNIFRTFNTQPAPRIRVTFQDPTDLGKIIVRSGAYDPQHPQVFKGSARPKHLELQAITTKGTEKPKTIALEDTSDPQTRTFDVNGVTALLITIPDYYHTAPASLHKAALSELEFRKKS